MAPTQIQNKFKNKQLSEWVARVPRNSTASKTINSERSRALQALNLRCFPCFQGVSVTTIILAPSACEMGVRAAGLATIWPLPSVPVVCSKSDLVAIRVTSELARSP